MMCMLCEHTLKGYYTKDMLGSMVDQRVFEVLLAQYQPKVFDHIQKLEIPIAWFTLPWFLCLFIGKLPLTVCIPACCVLLFMYFVYVSCDNSMLA